MNLTFTWVFTWTPWIAAARPPCPPPTPGVHSDSSPSSQWCHPAISSSVVPFSSCPQSLPASVLPMSQLFAWSGHLTSDSRMSCSRLVITPSSLSGLWRTSVNSYHLFLISVASVRSVPFLSFIVSIFTWKVPLVSQIFLKRSLVFPILLI